MWKCFFFFFWFDRDPFYLALDWPSHATAQQVIFSFFLGSAYGWPAWHWEDAVSQSCCYGVQDHFLQCVLVHTYLKVQRGVWETRPAAIWNGERPWLFSDIGAVSSSVAWETRRNRFCVEGRFVSETNLNGTQEWWVVSFYRRGSTPPPQYLSTKLTPCAAEGERQRSTRPAGGWRLSFWFRWMVNGALCAFVCLCLPDESISEFAVITHCMPTCSSGR